MHNVVMSPKTRTRAAWTAALTAAWLLGGQGACRRSGEPVSHADRPLVLVASGDTAGWIVPCGCAANQSGGLPRRGSYLEQLGHRADVVYLDVGGAPSGTPDYDRVKFEAILRGEAAMGVAAHNVGAAEAELGAEQLRRLAGETGVPLISANIVGADGQPIFPTHHAVTAGGRRILVIGVLDPPLAPDGLQTIEPRRAILETRERVGRRWDFVVVLAYLAEPRLRELASQLPEVDFVIGGPTGQAIAPELLGPTMLAAATSKGRFLVEIELPGRDPAGSPALAKPASARVVELDERWTDHPRQHENLREFYRVLADLDLAAGQTSFGSSLGAGWPDTYRLAGTDSCRSCHAGDCTAWDASGHARAWDTLAETGAHVDSYCQQCHTTGFGLPGGFNSARRSVNRANVGCESCHGPSHQHVENPLAPTAFYRQATGQCVHCHDRENSPNFDYAVYWQAIAHGDGPVKQRDPDGSGPLPEE
jgi:hypothetical protein